jgi:hypothetical protein
MEEKKFPYEDHLLTLAEGQKDIIIIKGRPFLIQPASEEDIETVCRGFFCMD